MATATSSKTTTRKPAAKKPAARKTKTTAQKAKTSAKSTPKAAAKTATKPVQERTVKNIVIDTAYATVGLTDTAVEVLKSLPAKAAELREEAPVRVKTLSTTLTTEAPKQVTARFQAVTTQSKATVTELRGQVESSIGSYADRGREVLGKVQNSAATKRALEQSRVARSQVKAAATSVRKAVGATADAAESAADKAGTVAS